jgi:hypothetical protein
LSNEGRLGPSRVIRDEKATPTTTAPRTAKTKSANLKIGHYITAVGGRLLAG